MKKIIHYETVDEAIKDLAKRVHNNTQLQQIQCYHANINLQMT